MTIPTAQPVARGPQTAMPRTAGLSKSGVPQDGRGAEERSGDPLKPDAGYSVVCARSGGRKAPNNNSRSLR